MNEDQSDEISDRDTMGGPTYDEPKAASEEAVSKSAGPVGSLGVVGGSNPVPAGVLDLLEWKWRSIAAQHRGDAEKTRSAIHRTRLKTAAETLEACALELRLLTDDVTGRQPESNVKDEPR